MEDEKLLAQARRMALREVAAEVLHERRKEITKRAAKKVSHIYAQLCINMQAGKVLK